jgi:hypothetical protein
MTKAPEKNQSYYENIQQWVQVNKKMMEGDVIGLCNTKCKTCKMTKDDDDALKRKGPSS